jgi:hypothetical protein
MESWYPNLHWQTLLASATQPQGECNTFSQAVNLFRWIHFHLHEIRLC